MSSSLPNQQFYPDHLLTEAGGRLTAEAGSELIAGTGTFTAAISSQVAPRRNALRFAGIMETPFGPALVFEASISLGSQQAALRKRVPWIAPRALPIPFIGVADTDLQMVLGPIVRGRSG